MSTSQKKKKQEKPNVILVTWLMRSYGVLFSGFVAKYLAQNFEQLEEKKEISNLSMYDDPTFNEKIPIIYFYPENYNLAQPKPERLRKKLGEDNSQYCREIKEQLNEHLEKIEHIEKGNPLTVTKLKKLGVSDKCFKEIYLYLPYEEQLELMRELYGENFEVRSFKEDLEERESYEDYYDIEDVLKFLSDEIQSIEKDFRDATIYINLYDIPNTVFTAWYLLENQANFPKNVKFIYARREEGSSSKFLPDFAIKLLESSPLDHLHEDFFKHPKGKQDEVLQKLNALINQGDYFSILLLGERGVGKSRAIKEAIEAKKEKDKTEKPFVHVNCGYFIDNSLTESELFGHKKGAFTGAYEDTEGYFHKADGGVLFLDEIHHLDKRTQAKLMVALQTDKDGFYKFHKVGSSEEEKVKFQIIMASNRTIEELREVLLPDFYDRIAQRIIQLPPLKKKNLRKYFDNVYREMKFKPYKKLSEEDLDEIVKFLKTLPLEGNYRDLQQIAISCHDYLSIDELKMSEKSLIDYVKKQYYLKQGKKRPSLKKDLTAKTLKKAFQKTLVTILEKEFHLSRKEIEKYLDIKPATLTNWKKEE